MTEVAMGYEIRDKIKEPTTITDIGNLKIINKKGMYYLEVEFLGETAVYYTHLIQYIIYIQKIHC